MLPISKEKPNYLILFFAKQCSIIDNDNEISSVLHLKTDTSLSNITFTEKGIENVIQNLDSNKGHGHDMIRIHMLKICGKSVTKSLLIVYKNGLNKTVFPASGRKQMLFLTIKK